MPVGNSVLYKQMGMIFGGWAEEHEEQENEREAARLKETLARLRLVQKQEEETNRADRPMTLRDD